MQRIHRSTGRVPTRESPAAALAWRKYAFCRFIYRFIYRRAGRRETKLQGRKPHSFSRKPNHCQLPSQIHIVVAVRDLAPKCDVQSSNRGRLLAHSHLLRFILRMLFLLFLLIKAPKRRMQASKTIHKSAFTLTTPHLPSLMDDAGHCSRYTKSPYETVIEQSFREKA